MERLEPRGKYIDHEHVIMLVMDAAAQSLGRESFTIPLENSDLQMLSRVSRIAEMIGYDTELADGGRLIATRKRRLHDF